MKLEPWMFDVGPAPDGRKWWHMVASYNWQELWLNAAGDCIQLPLLYKALISAEAKARYRVSLQFIKFSGQDKIILR